MSRKQLLARCTLVLFMSVMSSALLHAQTATSVVFPRYMQGDTPTNIDRIPFACRLRLSGLIANRTYRYFNQMVVSSDPSNSNGSGNCIFATPSGDFMRSISVSLSSLGNYGTFVTDGTGAYEGWFITEPTGGTRFTPGKFVFMRICVNDGAIGTTVANRFTTTDSVRVVKLAPGATDSTGTALRGASFGKPADFVFAYDNTTGIGRPISGSFLESDGTNNSISNFYSPFYDNSVNEIRGAYGMVLPNLLPNGVRRVERRALASGAVVVSGTDADGTWPSGAHTVNPLGGATAVVLTSADVNYLTAGLALDPSSRSFGNVAVSTTKTDSVLAKNTTGASLIVNSIVSSDTSAFVVTTTTPFTLSGGASKYVRIAFHPRVTGQRDVRMTFTNTGPTSPDTIHVDGNGIMVATSLIMPRFMEGQFPINIERIPFACRLRLPKLAANTTYRYYNQMVNSLDGPKADGGGNPIFATPSGDFVRTQNVDFDSTGDYGTFTTDATGIYDGWFITEPTAGDRFLPGKFVFMRINLNNGGTGDSVVTRITTTDSVRVVKLAPGATDSTGTGLRGRSFAKPRDFVFTYDNTAGTGRPISGSFFEDDGTKNSLSNFYSPFYADTVDGVGGSYGMVLPNLLATGVRRVERRALAGGAIVVAATDADGKWPSGAQTVNPVSGTNSIALTGADVNYLTTGLALDPVSLSFGDIVVSATKTDSVLAKNTSGSSMTISSIVPSDTSVCAVTTTTPVSLSAGASKYIRIVFHPRVPGKKDARITFTNSGNTSPDTIHVDGNGIALATSLIMPRFMEGQFPINIERIPFACRLRLSKLAASTTYRYYNQMVNSSDDSKADGGGNPIFATPSGDFVRTQAVDFDSTGDYGTFTTDATGTYDGWFITEPTAGDRFLPGKFVFMRIMLNGGGIGTTVATRITTTDSVRVVKLAPGATDSTGTGLRGISFAKSRDFVFTYDNTAGTGRPISGSFFEDDGTKNSLSNFYSPFYADTVNGVGGSYGMVLPNLLSTGVRRVERRALAGGAIVVSATDADGVWPSGAQTVNPVRGTNSIALTGADVNYLTTGLALDPSTLSFPDIVVSASKTDSVLAKNTSGSSITISSIVSSDTSSFAVTTTTPVSLSAGATKYIRFVFHPRFPGKKDARITFTNSGNTSPDTMHVDGHGLAIATSVVLPRFMEGVSPINSDRIPFACRLQLSKLLANTTYRYYNQVVTSSDDSKADGGGNPIFASQSGSFVRTVSVDFDTTGHYGTFATDATGAYEGWFVTEPTGGGRFLPGKFVFMRIILNGGGTGDSVATRVTTSDSVRIVKLNGAATDSTGTGLRGASFANARDFIFTYDNTAGTGRPISGSFVESDGTANSAANFYSPFYTSNVDGVAGAYGMVLPNLLATGVRRVERRSLATGAIVEFATDTDGKWPSGAQTVNPAGGATAIALTAADVGYLSKGLVFNPASLSFGNVAVSTSKTDSVYAKNTSGQNLSISSIVSSDTSAFAVTTTTPITVKSGDSTKVRIVFHPRVVGQRAGRITLTNTGPTSPDTLHVSGSGVIPSIAITPSPLAFGAVSIVATQLDSLKVRNPGTGTLSISSIVSSNPTQFEVVNGGAVSVLPGDSASIRVKFHPTIIGPRSGRITFTHNATTSPDTVHVQGTGVQLTAIVPRYLEGAMGTNTNRIPFAYRMSIAGLLANHAYRYFNLAVTSADPANSNGGGNCIFARADSAFVRSTSPDLSTPGNYGTLTTDSTGVCAGWFVTEPTANQRFTPGGFVFMRVCINDGGAGTTVFGRLTPVDSVRVVKLDPATADSCGTGLRGPAGNSRDFVFVYDDSAGAGRPVSGSFIENDGSINSSGNGYAQFYSDHVDTVGGAFGVVVPNLLPKGIRRIERRSLVSGAMVDFTSDFDGLWPGGANTVNPAGGTAEIVITAADWIYTTGVEPGPGVLRRFMLAQSGPNPFQRTTTIRFSVAESGVATLVVYDILGAVAAVPFNGLATPGQEYVVTVDAKRLPSGVYLYRLKSGNRTATRKMLLIR